MPSVVMNIRYVGISKINAVSDHEKNRTPDGASAIDPARSHLNRVLHGPATQADALKKLWAAGVKEPAAQAETPYVQMVLGASPEYFRDPSQGPGQWNSAKLKDWAKATRDWLRAEYGRDCVHISIHLDEDTPHIHALVVPTYDKRPRKPGRQKRNETPEQFEARKREAENAATVRAVGRSSNEKWRKNFARRDARKSYAAAVESLGIDYGRDFIAEGMKGPQHKTTGAWVKEQAAAVAAQKAKDAAKLKEDRNAVAAQVQALRDNLEQREKALTADRATLEDERAEVRGVMKRLNGLLEQAETFLRRPDLPALARKAGAALMKAAGRPVPTPDAVTGHGGGVNPDRLRKLAGIQKRAPASAPPQQSRPEPTGHDTGPGL